ncbi:MAG: SDR family oxidoreductase [Myxococcaceae bacterium]|nr:SDR family oxidoreductase [Myxococcaceae bacterium]MCA3011111.1 SDR family oxidoreductase [Myxococcaceae bacterium]
MTGKRVLVTGATAGIGLETARALAREGAELLLVGRNAEKTKATVAALEASTGNKAIVGLLADLSSVAEVKRLAAEVLARVDRLDVLINNAGAVNPKRETTADGFESTFATNHLAYFGLTLLLLPALRRAPAARVVSVASEAHRRAKLDFADLQSERYSAFTAYGRSKLANVLFTRELARRLEGSTVTANCLHPGVVASSFMSKPGLIGIFGKVFGVFMISSEAGAKTSVYLATSSEVERVSGRYFDKCKVREPSAAAQDDEAARRLWAESERLTGVTWAP